MPSHFTKYVIKSHLIYGGEIAWSEGFLPDIDYILSGMDPVRKVMIVLK
jgi:hypothetical protein